MPKSRLSHFLLLVSASEPISSSDPGTFLAALDAPIAVTTGGKRMRGTHAKTSARQPDRPDHPGSIQSHYLADGAVGMNRAGFAGGSHS